MQNFKVGDKVKIVQMRSDYGTERIGHEGEIVHIREKTTNIDHLDTCVFFNNPTLDIPNNCGHLGWWFRTADLEFISGSPATHNMTVEVGKRYKVKLEKTSNCGNIRKDGEIEVTRVCDPNDANSRLEYKCYSDLNVYLTSCSCLHISDLDLSATEDMTLSDLVVLTDEQKEALSPEDQALVRLGYVNDKLQKTTTGTTALTDFLWKQHKAELAEEAKAKILELEKADKKAKTVK